jgi:hypothetical protein
MTLAEAREILKTYKLPLTGEQLILYKEAMAVVSAMAFIDIPEQGEGE